MCLAQARILVGDVKESKEPRIVTLLDGKASRHPGAGLRVSTVASVQDVVLMCLTEAACLGGVLGNEIRDTAHPELQ